LTTEKQDVFVNIIAAYPGTFDPLTLGHVDLIQRAARVFSQVIVAVAANPGKSPLFSVDERCELAENVLADLPNVRVQAYSGLTVDFAQQHNVSVLVRGVRGVVDLEFENPIAMANRQLAPTVDTLFLVPSPEHVHISSSIVRDIARHGGDPANYLPPVVAAALHAKLAE